jgi:hypothetical protein
LTSFDQIALYHEARCAAAAAVEEAGTGTAAGAAARQPRPRRRKDSSSGGGESGEAAASFADSLEELCAAAALGPDYRIGDATNMVRGGLGDGRPPAQQIKAKMPQPASRCPLMGT